MSTNTSSAKYSMESQLSMLSRATSGNQRAQNASSFQPTRQSSSSSRYSRSVIQGFLDDRSSVSETTPLFKEHISYLLPAAQRRRRPKRGMNKWEFPGWGRKEDLNQMTPTSAENLPLLVDEQEHVLLGHWRATAICCNDITSSCFYVTGLLLLEAGKWGLISSILAITTLYFYKLIYAEVLAAVPMNGGTINVLLHTTTKQNTSFAAVFAILSYIATGIVSANSAIYYATTVFPSIPVEVATIALLGFFAMLNLIGLTESANVALGIFLIHLSTLAVLMIICVRYLINNGFSLLYINVFNPAAEINLNQSAVSLPLIAIFYGFSSAMLGCSGFETSSQYIQQQEPGVFHKTLRNMWGLVAIINPTLTFFAICIIDFKDLPKYSNTVLSELGYIVSTGWLGTVVSLDAFLVLAGAVLTGYVGVTGLIRRLASEECLPAFLLKTNRCCKTNHYIILGYFIICSSMYLALNGNIASLSQVYSMSFLGLLIMFAIGDAFLKYKRTSVIRPDIARCSWGTVFVAMGLAITALVSTIVKDVKVVEVFGIYFLGTTLVIAAMFFRVFILKMLLYCSSNCLKYRIVACCLGGRSEALESCFEDRIIKINRKLSIFFAKRGEIWQLNKAILYVKRNENCAWIKIVHAYGEENKKDLDKIVENVKILDMIYPKQRIDCVLVKDDFGIDLVQKLSKHYNIPPNRMFIACPSRSFQHTVASLGGVRVITAS